METYELNGVLYHLHYSIGRLEQIEQKTGASALSMLVSIGNSVLPPISVLKQYFAYGLMNDQSVYAPLLDAEKFALRQMETIGVPGVMERIMNQLQTDCGFLFQSTSSDSTI